MKSATMACTTLVGLFVCLGAFAHPAAAQQPTQLPAKAPVAPAAQTQGGQGQPIQGQSPQGQSPQGQSPQGQPAQSQSQAPSVGRHGQQARSGDRRRRTYASCNRLSHARGLRGGVRRRFLIRCKLGYERPKPAQNQAPQAPTPSQGRQP